MIAKLLYPKPIVPKRWCRNGMVPDAHFLRQLVNGQNHVAAYRRKTFMRWGDLDAPLVSAAGTRALWRFRCHTGYGATHMGFVLGMGRDDHGTASLPQVKFALTIAGGATTTEDVIGVVTGGGTSDSPSEISWRNIKIPITANTTYEVLISAVDYARPVSLCAYEIGRSDVPIDNSAPPLYALEPTTEQPVYDAIRENVLPNLSNMWRRNGAHLITWAGSGSTVSPVFGTTFANIIDGTSTTVTNNTPGYYLGDANEFDLNRHRRASKTTMTVVLAAHGQASAGTGEVRLRDTGTATTIGTVTLTTSAIWHTTTLTLSSLADITKVDIHAGKLTSGTLTLNAVSVYAYLA